MQIILLNEMCKYHKLVFDTEIIFSDDPKHSQKNLQASCRWNQGDANFRVSLQKYVINTPLYNDNNNTNYKYNITYTTMLLSYC